MFLTKFFQKKMLFPYSDSRSWYPYWNWYFTLKKYRKFVFVIHLGNGFLGMHFCHSCLQGKSYDSLNSYCMIFSHLCRSVLDFKGCDRTLIWNLILESTSVYCNFARYILEKLKTHHFWVNFSECFIVMKQ